VTVALALVDIPTSITAHAAMQKNRLLRIILLLQIS
jgi:hypothetical protein